MLLHICTKSAVRGSYSNSFKKKDVTFYIETHTIPNKSDLSNNYILPKIRILQLFKDVHSDFIIDALLNFLSQDLHSDETMDEFVVEMKKQDFMGVSGRLLFVLLLFIVVSIVFLIVVLVLDLVVLVLVV